MFIFATSPLSGDDPIYCFAHNFTFYFTCPLYYFSFYRPVILLFYFSFTCSLFYSFFYLPIFAFSFHIAYRLSTYSSTSSNKVTYIICRRRLYRALSHTQPFSVYFTLTENIMHSILVSKIACMHPLL